MAGSYIGKLVVSTDRDGRRLHLEKPFGYKDPIGVSWKVPKAAIVDGASIPRTLWSLIGGPFEGRYREASVIHDFYCDVRTRPWPEVHRVFYDAMLTSDVETLQAKAMYFAVRTWGPRWSDTVSVNAGLVKGGRGAGDELIELDTTGGVHGSARDLSTLAGAVSPGALSRVLRANIEARDVVATQQQTAPPPPGGVVAASTRAFEAMKVKIAAEDLSAEDIESLADAARSRATAANYQAEPG